MADPQTAGSPKAGTTQTQEVGLLDQIVQEGRFGAEPAARERGRDLVKEFVAQFLDGSMTIARDADIVRGITSHGFAESSLLRRAPADRR